jgi:hypothetical protein
VRIVLLISWSAESPLDQRNTEELGGEFIFRSAEEPDGGWDEVEEKGANSTFSTLLILRIRGSKATSMRSIAPSILERKEKRMPGTTLVRPPYDLRFRFDDQCL